MIQNFRLFWHFLLLIRTPNNTRTVKKYYLVFIFCEDSQNLVVHLQTHTRSPWESGIIFSHARSITYPREGFYFLPISENAYYFVIFFSWLEHQIIEEPSGEIPTDSTLLFYYPHLRELSIIRNLAQSTLNLGLWWESDSLEILRFLHYKCGMPEHMIRQHIIDPAAPPPVAQDVDQPEIKNDWRAFNKPSQGITYQTAIYSPLAFRRADPKWIQHWLMNALGIST